DVAAQAAAAPAPDDGGRLARADRRLDLRLEGVVLERREFDLAIGVGLVEPLRRPPADAFLRFRRQEPVAGLGAAATALAAATGGAGAGGAARGERGSQGQAHRKGEESAARGCPGLHADLRI